MCFHKNHLSAVALLALFVGGLIQVRSDPPRVVKESAKVKVGNVQQVAAQVGYSTAGRPNCDSTVTRTSGGYLYGYSFSNSTTSPRYVKLYDLNRDADPTKDIPGLCYLVPPNSTIQATLAFGTSQGGIGYTYGISVRVTTGPAYDDQGACKPWDVMVNLYQGGL